MEDLGGDGAVVDVRVVGGWRAVGGGDAEGGSVGEGSGAGEVKTVNAALVAGGFHYVCVGLSCR